MKKDTNLADFLAFASQWCFYQDYHMRMGWLYHPFNPDLAYHPLGIRITQKHLRDMEQKRKDLDQREDE